jgi:formylglycine-generating enzyme required for sulfatase activity
MVLIPAGSFTMGSPETEANRDSNETQRQVTLTNGFYMGRYQVTQAQYEAVMGSNPSYFHGVGSGREPASGEVQGRRPVERISWYDTLVFCNRLSIAEGLSPAYSINDSTNPDDWGPVPTTNSTNIVEWNSVTVVSGSNGYRLPTEAQWEYACRAGTTTAYNVPVPKGSNRISSINNRTGWSSANSNYMTHEVGLKAANNWGLYDMHGNVYEWCWDWYEDYASGAHDPTGAATGFGRVIRGGSRSSLAEFTRSAYRFYYGPNNRDTSIGFRLLRPEF